MTDPTAVGAGTTNLATTNTTQAAAQTQNTLPTGAVVSDTIPDTTIQACAQDPSPDATAPAGEHWHGVIVGFAPNGQRVSLQIQCSNCSRSWVERKLEETSSMLQRTNGFRFQTKSHAVGINYGESTIILLHPSLNCLSFEITVKRCAKPAQQPPCMGECVNG